MHLPFLQGTLMPRRTGVCYSYAGLTWKQRLPSLVSCGIISTTIADVKQLSQALQEPKLAISTCACLVQVVHYMKDGNNCSMPHLHLQFAYVSGNIIGVSEVVMFNLMLLYCLGMACQVLQV